MRSLPGDPGEEKEEQEDFIQGNLPWGRDINNQERKFEKNALKLQEQCALRWNRLIEAWLCQGGSSDLVLLSVVYFLTLRKYAVVLNKNMYKRIFLGIQICWIYMCVCDRVCDAAHCDSTSLQGEAGERK